VPDAAASTPTPRSRTRSPSQWPTFLSNNATTTTHYVQIQASQPTTSIQIVPSTPPIIIPHSPPHYDWSGGLSPPPPPPPLPSAVNPSNQSRASSHWGHIVIYYLVEQMHRWERFVFRFDRQFPSWQALKSVSGASSAPAYLIQINTNGHGMLKDPHLYSRNLKFLAPSRCITANGHGYQVPTQTRK
jgi:hypothetical protein